MILHQNFIRIVRILSEAIHKKKYIKLDNALDNKPRYAIMDKKMISTNQNTGVLVKPPAPTDWIAGEETGIAYQVNVMTGDWTPYLPDPEKQKGRFVETMACVSFSALNCIETQINWMLSEKLIPENDLAELNLLGMIDKNGKFNASDRFVAKMSGTTHQGNYLTNVWQAIRDFGLVSEADWPFDMQDFDWETYYYEIPEDVKKKALRIKEVFEFNYEYVNCGMVNFPLEEISKHLLQAPLQLAAPVCSPWNGGIIKSCGLTNPGHATEVYGDNEQSKYVKIFDTYDPFEKKLDSKYPMPYLIKGVVRLKQPIKPLPEFHHTFNKRIAFGQRNDEVKALQTALKIDGEFPANVETTGFYGKITQKAVKDFMEKYQIGTRWERLSIDGKSVGPLTRAKLNELFGYFSH